MQFGNRRRFVIRDKGIWPETAEILNQESYVELPAGIKAQWQFGIIGNPPQTLVAVSTDKMSDGAGRTIAYNIAQDKWQGYGLAKLKQALEHFDHSACNLYEEAGIKKVTGKNLTSR